MLGKIEGRRRRGWQRIRWLDIITNSMDMNLSKLQETVKDRQPEVPQSTGSQRVGHDLATNNSYKKILITVNIFYFTVHGEHQSMSNM